MIVQSELHVIFGVYFVYAVFVGKSRLQKKKRVNAAIDVEYFALLTMGDMFVGYAATVPRRKYL